MQWTVSPRRHAVLAMAVLVLTAASAPAADDRTGAAPATGIDVLHVIPAEALGFVVVPRLADTNSRVASLGMNAQLPLPAPLDMVKGMTGIAAGLDEERSFAIVAMPAKGDAPPVRVVLVPTSNFKRLVRQLQPEDMLADVIAVTVAGEPMLAAEKAGYAVLVGADDEAALQRVLASKKSIVGNVEPLADWMQQQHSMAVLTPAGLKLFVRQVLKQFKEAEEQIGALDDAAADPENPQQLPPGMSTEALSQVFGIYRDVLQGAQTELTHIAVGVRIDDKSNVYFNSRAILKEGGKIAEAADDAEAPEGDLLALLPDQEFILAGGSVSAESWNMNDTALHLMTAGFKVLGTELTPEQERQLKDAARSSSQGVRSRVMVVGQLSDPESTVYDNMYQVVKVDDAQEYLERLEEGTRQMAKLMQEVGFADKMNMPVPTVKALEIDGHAAVEVITKFPDPAADGAAAEAPAGQMPLGLFEAQAQRFQEILGASGTIHQYVVVADDQTLVVLHNKDEAGKIIRAATSGGPGLAGNEQIQHTAALLPKQPTMVGYLSAGGVVGFIDRAVTEALGDAAIPIPAFPPSPPIGLAVTVNAEHIDNQLVVPVEVLQGVTQYIPLILFSLPMQNMGGPLPVQ